MDLTFVKSYKLGRVIIEHIIMSAICYKWSPLSKIYLLISSLASTYLKNFKGIWQFYLLATGWRRFYYKLSSLLHLLQKWLLLGWEIYIRLFCWKWYSIFLLVLWYRSNSSLLLSLQFSWFGFLWLFLDIIKAQWLFFNVKSLLFLLLVPLFLWIFHLFYIFC